MEVHKDPRTNPKTGPRILIPILMAAVETRVCRQQESATSRQRQTPFTKIGWRFSISDVVVHVRNAERLYGRPTHADS